MMDGHFFVSYSRADAADVGTGLRDRFLADSPPYRLWVDKRDMVAGVDWDDQIDDAIQGCRALLLVMTPDSVRRGSGCRQEVAWALKYKKPVIPLRFETTAELPFRISSRQYIDFADGVDQGAARLRIFLDELDGPAGRMRELRFQLADAEREVPRAVDDAQRARIEQDVKDLRLRISEMETIAADPARAALKADERIAAGMEAVRSPDRPGPEQPARAKFVNPPPATAPSYFQDRHVETALLSEFLVEPDAKLVTVVGRGGVGKTAIVCRLLKGLEKGTLPDELGEQSVDGIVYLKGNLGAHPATFANLFADLSRLLPAETADPLRQRYLEPHETPAMLMSALLDEFPTEQHVVVLLDNFEDLLDSDGVITDLSLDEALRALLSAPAHGVTVVITTRVTPAELVLYQPGAQRRIDLDDGLASPYAEQVLRARDPDGVLGLRKAPDAALGLLRVRTRGYPRALEAVAAILAADRNTTLDELIAQTERLPDNVVHELVGDAFNRLDPLAQQVMQALAIYPVPVPAVAVDYLLQPYISAVNAGPVLGRLVNMQFARRDAGLYYLHQVDRDYALDRLPIGRPEDRGTNNAPFTQYALRDRAGDYFAVTQTPRDEWKTLEDMAAQLAEFEMRVEGHDYDSAAMVLLGIDFDYLITWGHYRYTVELHTRLQGHIKDLWTMGASMTNLGTCALSLGQIDRAIGLCEQALAIDRELGDRPGESTDLGNLGNCYAALGQIDKAKGLYEQALDIARQEGVRLSEANWLTNVGNCLADLGEFERSIELHEQALDIDRELADRRGESTDLGNLGLRYEALGQTEHAYGLHEQALAIAREVGDRNSEAIHLTNLGSSLCDLGQWTGAVPRLQDAVAIGDTIGSAQSMAEARAGLAWALLGTGDLSSARIVADEAGGQTYPRARTATALIAGIIRLRMHDVADAVEALDSAVDHAEADLRQTPRDFSAWDIKALALVALSMIGSDDHTDEAVSSFRAAREITSAPGITAKTTRLLDAIAAADPAKDLVEVYSAASGNDR